jgi:DNA invertase Pin-like site-specific DNA recombinase
VHNLESQRRQYGLAERARQLGWTSVEIIDDDLGRSGGGMRRPGFERLVAAICDGRVGAVLAIEVSRLARNGRDWHTLIEFCGLVGTIIVDEDGIYDPRHPNDRLLLGMKGPQARAARTEAPDDGMGCAHQGPARRLYLVGAVREEPARDQRQCDGQGQRHGARGGSAR